MSSSNTGSSFEDCFGSFAANLALFNPSRFGGNALLANLNDHHAPPTTTHPSTAPSFLHMNPASMVDPNRSTVNNSHHGNADPSVHQSLDEIIEMICTSTVFKLEHAIQNLPLSRRTEPHCFISSGWCQH